MIEIEKKFEGDARHITHATAGLTKTKTVRLEDIYYDNETYALTSKDNWLRNRNGRFELKLCVPLGDRSPEHPYDNYREIDDEAAIRAELKLEDDLSLADAIAKAGFAPFGPIITDREEYHDGIFTLDVDRLPNGKILIEVEVLIEDNGDIGAAERQLATFTKGRGLTKEAHYGKIFEFLKANRPEHYQVLKAAGVIDKYYPE